MRMNDPILLFDNDGPFGIERGKRSVICPCNVRGVAVAQMYRTLWGKTFAPNKSGPLLATE